DGDPPCRAREEPTPVATWALLALMAWSGSEPRGRVRARGAVRGQVPAGERVYRPCRDLAREVSRGAAVGRRARRLAHVLGRFEGLHQSGHDRVRTFLVQAEALAELGRLDPVA